MSAPTNGDLNTNSAHSFTGGAESGAAATFAPRTDALAEYTGSNIDQVAMLTDFASTLERELAKLKSYRAEDKRAFDAVCAERDQLQADLNDAKDHLDTCMLAKNKLVQDRERLEAELKEARMDTTRLQEVFHNYHSHRPGWIEYGQWKRDLDAYIAERNARLDAPRKETP